MEWPSISYSICRRSEIPGRSLAITKECGQQRPIAALRGGRGRKVLTWREDRIYQNMNESSSLTQAAGRAFAKEIKCEWVINKVRPKYRL
jgi:hypothetical protein